MKVQFIVQAVVDEDALAEHNQANDTATEAYPLPRKPDDYNIDDLRAALDAEILTDAEVVDFEVVLP